MGDANTHLKKSPPEPQGVRLAEFIHTNEKQIVSEWESFARTLKPVANDMTPLALRDHIHEILTFIVRDIKSPQTRQEQAQKSKGAKKKNGIPSAAETHAALRLAGGFNIDQMVSEYRALRASVIKLWSIPNTQMDKTDIADLTRFNESIDQELTESVSHYTKKVNYSKDLFIGILSHELRNPLNVVSMSAQLMLSMGAVNERQTMLTKQIFESTERMSDIIGNLLDVTRARFGVGLTVIKAPMDMGMVSTQLVDEMRIAHPTRKIILTLSANTEGEWDKARIGQVFTNLIGNAIQYSFKDSSISVIVKGSPKHVMISVHNEGAPVPIKKIKTIFDALARAVSVNEKHPKDVNLGLGLYITKEIVVAHGGTIDVTSTKEAGTTFIVRLPRAI